MIFKYTNNPFHQWLKSNTEIIEHQLEDINIVDPLLKHKEQESQLIGVPFYQQLNKKIQVIEDHHIELNKQLNTAPFSTIIKNQKQLSHTANKKSVLNNTNNYENNFIHTYSFQNHIPVYSIISSLIKFDPSLIWPQYIAYHFNKNTHIQTQPYAKASELLDLAFLSMGYLTSKPKYKITPDKLIIQLFYYKQTKKASDLMKLSIKGKLLFLINQLFNLFGMPVELDMTRLYKPHTESTILAKALIIRSYQGRFLKLVSDIVKKIKFEDKSNIDNFTAYHYDLVPSFLSGIKIRLGGRTFRQRIIPRKTVQSLQRGTLARTKARYIEKAQISHKTRRGAFSFTVHIGHVF